MKYILFISFALLALSSATGLRHSQTRGIKSLLQQKTGSQAIDWAAKTPNKCQLILFTESDFEGSQTTVGTDKELSAKVSKQFKSLRISHGCKLTTEDTTGVTLAFSGDIANLEDYGWYKRAVKYSLIDQDKKCTVRLFSKAEQVGDSIDVYSSNPDLASHAAFSNAAQSYKIWDCDSFLIRAYPYKNYIGYLDLHAGNSHTTFATGISSIQMLKKTNEAPVAEVPK